MDYFRSRFPGASAGTPFIDGGECRQKWPGLPSFV